MKRLLMLCGLLLVCAAVAQPAASQHPVFILVLADQPVQELAPLVGAPFRAYLGELREQARGIMAAQRPSQVLSDEEEAQALAAAGRSSRTEQEQLAELSDAADHTLDQMRQAVLAAAEPLLERSQVPVAAAVQTAGGEVLYRYRLLNAMAVRLPAGRMAQLEQRPDVAAIIPDEQIESQLDTSVAALGTGTWWANGENGGIWDVAVLDSGVDQFHPAFAGHTVIADYFLATAGNPGWDTHPDDVNGHGTHVAGIISSGDSVYRGVAYGHDLLFNLKAGYDTGGGSGGPASMYWSDAMAAVDWAFSNPVSPEVFNLSYGACATVGDSGFGRFWDAVVDSQLVGVSISAGNDGGTCIHYPSIAYNVLSVANVDDRVTITRFDDQINPSSSRGPAPGGRRKPDIAAPGTWIASAHNLYDEGGGDWVSYTGTSQAAPHVAGALLLALDGNVLDPRAQKALLINTADDLGATGWDAAWGWGYMNLTQAYYHRSDVFEGTVSSSPDYDLYQGPFLSGDTATLVWNRHVNYSGATYPPSAYSLNDLNLYLYNAANNLVQDTAVSIIDNVEQVQVGTDFTGVMRVQSFSTLQGVSAEEYALATEENFQRADGPSLAVSGKRVFHLESGEIATVTLTVENSGDLTLFAAEVALVIPAGVTMTHGTNPVALGNLTAGNGDSIIWAFQKAADDVVLTVDIMVEGNGYGLDFSEQVRVYLIKPPDVFMPLVSKHLLRN